MFYLHPRPPLTCCRIIAKAVRFPTHEESPLRLYQ